MKKEIKIAGVKYEIRDLNVGESQLLDGAGKIREAAVKRVSESRYKIFVILEYEVIEETFYSIGLMLGYLQATYDTHGGLA